MTSGVYLLRFPNTSKVYIGQSKHIEKRFLEHLSSFRCGSASIKLQEAYLEYGNPLLEILLECSNEELILAETDAINIYDSVSNGFNTMFNSGVSSSKVGEDTSSAIYSNIQIERVFELLISTSMHTHKFISENTGVSISAIAQVSSGITHKWLQDKYPDKYKILLNLVYIRRGLKQAVKTTASTTSKYTKEQYIEVLSLAVQKIKAKDIHKLTGVGIDVIRDITSCRRHKWLEIAEPIKYQQLKLIKQKG